MWRCSLLIQGRGSQYKGQFLSLTSLMMNTQVNMVVWNCRGAGKKGFGSFIKDISKLYGFYILVLLETRHSGTRADKVASKLGFDSLFRVDADGFAGGIWIFWDSAYCKLKVLISDEQFVHVEVTSLSSACWLFTPCYGRPQRVIREELWRGLKNLSQSIVGHWIVAGYFNSILFYHKVSGGTSSRKGCSAF